MYTADTQNSSNPKVNSKSIEHVSYCYLFSHLLVFHFGYFRRNFIAKVETKDSLNSLSTGYRNLGRAADRELNHRRGVPLQRVIVGTRQGCLDSEPPNKPAVTLAGTQGRDVPARNQGTSTVTRVPEHPRQPSPAQALKTRNGLCLYQPSSCCCHIPMAT